MKIACVSTSRIPSSTANSIQVMKACHALAVLGHEVCLWVPGENQADWAGLSETYGLTTPFEIRWLPSKKFWRRYDFSLVAMQEAKRWGAKLFYTWLLPAAVLSLWQGIPTLLELHDVVTGQVGPRSYQMFCKHWKTKKRLLVITQALKNKLETQSGIQLGDEDVQIAPNGADLERYANLPDPATARFQLGLPEIFTAVYSGHSDAIYVDSWHPGVARRIVFKSAIPWLVGVCGLINDVSPAVEDDHFISFFQIPVNAVCLEHIVDPVSIGSEGVWNINSENIVNGYDLCGGVGAPKCIANN